MYILLDHVFKTTSICISYEYIIQLHQSRQSRMHIAVAEIIYYIIWHILVFICLYTIYTYICNINTYICNIKAYKSMHVH